MLVSTDSFQKNLSRVWYIGMIFKNIIELGVGRRWISETIYHLLQWYSGLFHKSTTNVRVCRFLYVLSKFEAVVQLACKCR